jgi:hypothetical protein
MSRMFIVGDKAMVTWNVFVGCDFGCTYCNARKLAEGRLKNVPRYRDGFKPHLVEEELGRRFHPGDFVFIGYMGDISFATRDIVANFILPSVRTQPAVRFLFCSKNPAVYGEWGFEYPDNLSLAATIETNRDFGLTKAPPPQARYEAMKELSHPHKFISIEPIMDFHLATMVRWMKEIGPEIIEIGADNYYQNLVEPYGVEPEQKAPWKVRWLIEDLRKFCPTVVEKKGLERLKREAFND